MDHDAANEVKTYREELWYCKAEFQAVYPSTFGK
jgi:hypothetical protein